jgi:COP9 signalosome complex subunit 5
MDQQLEKIVRDSNKIAGEERTGLMAGEVKAKLFNGLGDSSKGEKASSAGPVET